MLAGELYPEIQTVQYDRLDEFLPVHEKNAKRIYEYVTSQKPVITKYSAFTGLLVFDGSCPGDAMSVKGLENIRKLLNEFYRKPVDNLSTFEWQHSTADFSKIIRKGIRHFINDIEVSKEKHRDNIEKQEFLSALKKVAEALIEWAHICSGEAKKLAESVTELEYKNNLNKLSDALLRVPEYPAENFYEAVLSLYVVFSYAPDSIGTLDRTLSEYYFRDIDSGVLTREEACGYLQELFLMLQAKTPIDSSNFTRGGESHFCVGGYLPNGEDCFNDLSLLILEAMTELPTYIPQISLRWTKKLPFESFVRVLDFERNDKNKRIAFVNDETKIRASMNLLGFSYKDACTYTTLGCNEVAFPGGMVAGNSNCNGLHSVESTFYNRTNDILSAKTFDEFYIIYRQELEKDIDRMLELDDNYNLVRSKDASYVTSLLFPECITEAKPFSQGPVKLAGAGCSIIGLTNIIDSLAIVKQFVFDEKIITMKELVDALTANWKGYEDLHTLIMKKGNFFGNDDETSNYIARLFSDTMYDIAKNKCNIFGYKIRFGNLQGYIPHHEWFGKGTKATPDGRRCGEKLKFGFGQNDGKDRNGLTALLNSVAKCDPSGIVTAGSSVTNLYLEDKLIKDDTTFLNVARMLETYFLNGGTHFQLNYLSKNDLIKAKESPEEHKNLRVRVSGFSDYFIRLTESVQDDIIDRTVQK